jgi:hypothetical protein
MATIRKTTVENAVKEITALRIAAIELTQESEAKHNFVTEKCQKQADRLNAKAEKLQTEIVSRLIDAGLCTDEFRTGLTAKDADNEFFAGIDSLWEIGNGDWC